MILFFAYYPPPRINFIILYAHWKDNKETLIVRAIIKTCHTVAINGIMAIIVLIELIKVATTTDEKNIDIGISTSTDIQSSI